MKCSLQTGGLRRCSWFYVLELARDRVLVRTTQEMARLLSLRCLQSLHSSPHTQGCMPREDISGKTVPRSSTCWVLVWAMGCYLRKINLAAGCRHSGGCISRLTSTRTREGWYCTLSEPGGNYASSSILGFVQALAVKKFVEIIVLLCTRFETTRRLLNEIDPLASDGVNKEVCSFCER